MPEVAVSSTLVRERVAAGDSIDDLVPDAVADFIAERGLYEALERAGAAGRGDRRRQAGGGSVVLDMRRLVGYTDFLVICTARNERQAKAIVDDVRERLKHDEGVLPGRVEGQPEARWVLLDYLDCVLHVFTPEARDSTGWRRCGVRRRGWSWSWKGRRARP